MQNEKSKHSIIIGQPITQEKRQLALQMRSQPTPQEQKLWQKLRRSALGAKFRQQQIIDGFIADFYCHAAGLIVEIDGSIHSKEYDTERDRILTERRLTILRFSNDEVESNLSEVISKIKRHLPTHPPPPQAPS